VAVSGGSGEREVKWTMKFFSSNPPPSTLKQCGYVSSSSFLTHTAPSRHISTAPFSAPFPSTCETPYYPKSRLLVRHPPQRVGADDDSQTLSPPANHSAPSGFRLTRCKPPSSSLIHHHSRSSSSTTCSSFHPRRRPSCALSSSSPARVSACRPSLEQLSDHQPHLPKRIGAGCDGSRAVQKSIGPGRPS